MNTKETAQVLAIVQAAYPTIKPSNPESTVKAWAWTLGDCSKEDVLNAVRLHISTNRYFPNPADIREKIVKAQIIYGNKESGHDKLEAHNTKLLADHTSSIKWTDEQLQKLWVSLGGAE